MKILFYISKRYSYPIIKPIVDELRKSKKHTIAFYLFPRTVNDFPLKWLRYQVFELPEAAIDFAPDFVLVPGNFVDYRIPGMKVQIFHGLGVEKPAHFKIRPHFDLYLTSGPYVTNKFKRLQKKHDHFYVEETGWAKIDHILEYDFKDLKAKFNIPKGKKVVLYAPTFSNKMESASALLPYLKQTIKDNEFWLIKFHELMNRSKIENLFREDMNNVRIIDDFDITPYLHLADVLISDTSSVNYEFMILDKPIITYRTLSRYDKGINITEPNELREALDEAINNPADRKYNRIVQLNDIHPYNNLGVSKRIIETLEKYHRLKIPSKRRHLNFFRRFQTLKSVYR